MKDAATSEHTPEGSGNKLRRCRGRPQGECADGSEVQQKGVCGGRRAGEGEVNGNREPGGASEVTVVIPDLLTYEVGDHWTLLNKARTCI